MEKFFKLLRNALILITVLLLVACMVYSCVRLIAPDQLKPSINRVNRAVFYEYADTTRFCNISEEDFFCIRVKEPIREISGQYHCANCGAAWGRHLSSFECTMDQMPHN